MDIELRQQSDKSQNDSYYCYSYLRISSKRQLSGDGLNRQAESSRRYCDDQGWTMVEDFKLEDVGKSAYYSHNLDPTAALGKFIEAMNAGMIRRPAVLLVENLDRLSRAGIMDALQLFISILQGGVAICTYQDRMLYTREGIQSNFGPLIISITIMARAHEESATKSKRLLSSWAAKRKSIDEFSVLQKRILPCWIKIENDKPVLDKEKAKTIRMIFEWCLNGYGIKKTCERLIAEKIPPISGDKWARITVQRLFQTKRVLGIYEPTIIKQHASGRRERIPTGEAIKAYPSVISDDIYYKARSIIEGRKKGNPGVNISNLFRGLLRCGCCGGPYVLSGKASNKILRCNDRATGMAPHCDQKSRLLFSKIEGALIQTTTYINLSDILDSTKKSAASDKADYLKIQKQKLNDILKSIENLTDLIAEGSKMGVKKVVELEAEQAQIERDIESARLELKELTTSSLEVSIDSINKFWKNFIGSHYSEEAKLSFNSAVSKVINRIDIFSPKGECERARISYELIGGKKLMLIVDEDYSCVVKKGSRQLAHFNLQMN